MTNAQLLRQKREIEGVEVIHAIAIGYEMAELHKEEDAERIVTQVVMSVLFDPDLIDKNREAANQKMKEIGGKVRKVMEEVFDT